MKRAVTTLAALAYLLAVPGQAQQASTTPPAPTQQQPCSTASTPGKPNTKTPGTLTDPNSKIGKFVGKYSPVDPGSIFNSKPKPAAPCPPAAPVTQAAPAMPGTTATTGNKPAMVCPPHTTLIPNTPYCLTAEHTTVDAIALPPGMAAPATAAKATPGATTPQQ